MTEWLNFKNVFVAGLPAAGTFTLLGRQYTVLTIVRLVVCVCGYLVLRRAFLIYARKAHMQQLKAQEEQEKDVEEEEEEVTVHKNKPMPLDYESEGGSKARKRQREATRRRAGEEAERRNLEEERGGGLKSIWISGGGG